MRELIKHKASSTRHSRGVYITLFALLIFVLVALLAVAIGLTLVATDATRLQHMTNAASLAAIKNYVERLSESPTPTHLDAGQTAAQRAGEIAHANRLAGTSNPVIGEFKYHTEFNPADPDHSGRVIPGGWFPFDPDLNPSPPFDDGPLEPCEAIGASYPCFVPDNQLQSGLAVNAVRVEASTQLSNPVIAPFAGLMGRDKFQISTASTASLVQRCTAYVLDITLTSTLATHFFPYITPPPACSTNCFDEERTCAAAQSGNQPSCFPGPVNPPLQCAINVFCPLEAGLFALRVAQLGVSSGPLDPNYTTSGALGARLCSPRFPPGASPLFASDNLEGRIWCQTVFGDSQTGTSGPNDWEDRLSWSPGAPTDGLFRQDYADLASVKGLVRMDVLKDPQPLGAFFLAFNAGLRLVKQQSTAADRAVVIPFTGRIANRYPQSGTTRDIDLLVQLTNMSNRGMITNISNPTTISRAPEVHPNFVDMGWFPLLPNTALDPGSNYDDETDIVLALDTAIDALSTQCPASAQRMIVLATDGVSGCDRTYDPATTPPFTGLPRCPEQRIFSVYQNARNQILDVDDPNSVVSKLRRNRISLSTLIAGAHVGPNFKNIVQNPGPPVDWVEMEEAAALGYSENFFDGGATVPPGHPIPPGGSVEEEAFLNLGKSGFFFRDPNAVFGSAAFLTGGIYCPLMPVCIPADCDAPSQCGAGTTTCYDPPAEPGAPERLKDCARAPGAPQTCALFNESFGQQAARCVAQAVSGNPYILVR